MATSSFPEQAPGNGRELERALKVLNLRFEDVVFSDDSSKCRVCERPRSGDPFCSLCDSPGFICSDKCYHNFWADVTQNCSSKQGGRRICLFPCCTKDCYVEPVKKEISDHCNLYHRDGHQKILQQMYGCSFSEIPRCQLSECRRICSIAGIYSSFFHDFCCKRHSIIQKQRTEFCEKCQQSKSAVRFYNSTDPYCEFTNFYEFAPFKLDGKKWKSSEHYFQAQKFIGTPYEETIRNTNSPRSAFELARKYSGMGWQRKDWEDVKLFIMYKALLAKFTTCKHLRLLLHSTGERELVEHTFNDSYWGDGGTDKGSNYLGKLLEDVRRVLRGMKRRILQL